MSGQVTEGEALPQHTGAGQGSRISVITTKRAYDELENEGFIYTLPWQGLLRGGAQHGAAAGGKFEEDRGTYARGPPFGVRLPADRE